MAAEPEAKPLRTDLSCLGRERHLRVGSCSGACPAALQLHHPVARSLPVLQIVFFVGAILAAFFSAGAARAQNTQLSIPNDPPLSPATSNTASQSATPSAVQGLELYSGLDLASHGWAFGWLEATVAPYSNANTSGLRVRLYGEAGEDQDASNRFVGVNTETWYNTDFLIGYAFEKDHFDLELYAGAAAIEALLARPDPTNSLQGAAIGPKLEGEFSWTNNGYLLHGEAYYTTAFGDYQAKLQLDHQIIDQIYIGPEFTFLGDRSFSQWRIGANLVATNIGNLRVSVGAGYENDSDTGTGLYGTIEAGLQY